MASPGLSRRVEKVVRYPPLFELGDLSAGSFTRRCSAPPSRICPLWLVGGAESDHSYADGVGPDSVRHRLLAGDGCHAVYRCGDGSQAWAERLGAAAGLAAKLRHEGVTRTGDGGVVGRPAGAASKRGHRHVRTQASVRRTSGGIGGPALAARPTAKRFLEAQDPEPFDLRGSAWEVAGGDLEGGKEPDEAAAQLRANRTGSMGPKPTVCA